MDRPSRAQLLVFDHVQGLTPLASVERPFRAQILAFDQVQGLTFLVSVGRPARATFLQNSQDLRFGTYGRAYLAGLLITYIAVLDRLMELEKFAGDARKQRMHELWTALARQQ